MGRRRTPGFGDFWDAYGLKRDRLAAERAWNRLSSRDRTAAFDGIASYREACRRRGIAMMYGQGYLSHRRWEDEDGTQPSAPTTAPAEARPFPEPDALPDPYADMETW